MTPPSCTLSQASVLISEMETAGLGDVQSGFGGKKSYLVLQLSHHILFYLRRRNMPEIALFLKDLPTPLALC